MSQQQRLFNEAANPLSDRLGDTFFDELPTIPGVYIMYGKSGRVLYVGKAKNLRNRLFFYRRVNNDNSSRKTRKLVRMITDVEIRICETEEAALLKENELIREYRPEFNRAKKSPETYYFLSLKLTPSYYRFRLSMEMPADNDELLDYTYGAFKGHRTIRKGTGALLRQLYLLEHEVNSAFDFPTVLTNKLTPLTYQMSAEKHLVSKKILQEFLAGKSLKLISKLIEIVSRWGLLGEYIGRLILKDCEALKYLYERCLNRNQQIKDTLGLNQRLIPQQKLDDYLIRMAFKEG